MKLMALTERQDHVSYRYRLGAFATILARRGWSLAESPLVRNLPGRLRQLRSAAQADVVVLQRKLLPLWQLRSLRRAARFLIYDVDDALFVRDSFHRKGHASWNRHVCFWAAVYSADAVTAGNAYLADRARRYAGDDRVYLVPTSVDPWIYRTADHLPAGRRARLVWIGQASTMQGLLQLHPHLLAATAAVEGLELRIVSNRAPTLDGIRVVAQAWSERTEAAQLADADIGIACMPDDPWSLGKCGLKVLQYMAAGLPVVANPVGVHRQLVQHGRTGFLAETPEQWSRAIALLAADAGLRQRLGAAGRALVEQEYSVGKWGAQFAQIVEAAAAQPRGIHPTSWAGERRLHVAAG